jgi:CheY-like chemotaxis protein
MIVVAARILVVDQDRKVLEWVQSVLETAGYSAILTTDFEEARAAMTTLAPDLLLVDVRLGEFNGLQLVTEAPAGLPCIVMTGFADDAEVDALQLGSYYVVKPMDADGLLVTIRQALANAERRLTIGSRRHWDRKKLLVNVFGTVDGAAMRLVDVSYGGMRLEIDSSHGLSQSCTVRLSEPPVSINVMSVWKQETEEHTVCGAVLSTGNAAAVNDWVSLVDRLA